LLLLLTIVEGTTLRLRWLADITVRHSRGKVLLLIDLDYWLTVTFIVVDVVVGVVILIVCWFAFTGGTVLTLLMLVLLTWLWKVTLVTWRYCYWCWSGIWWKFIDGGWRRHCVTEQRRWLTAVLKNCWLWLKLLLWLFDGVVVIVICYELLAGEERCYIVVDLLLIACCCWAFVYFDVVLLFGVVDGLLIVDCVIVICWHCYYLLLTVGWPVIVVVVTLYWFDWLTVLNVDWRLLLVMCDGIVIVVTLVI